jgi:hypothetical protein
VVTAAHMNTHIRDNLKAAFGADMFDNSTWNCAIHTTGSTGPNGQTINGDYVRVGPLVSAWGRTNLDTSTAFGTTGGAFYYITPPKNLASYVATGSVSGAAVGSGFYYDNSAVDTYVLTVVAYTTNKFIFRFNNVGTTEIGVVCSTNPTAMSTADRFSFHLSYPCAAT